MRDCAAVLFFALLATWAVHASASERSGVIPSRPCDPHAEPSSPDACQTPVRDFEKPQRDFDLETPSPSDHEEHSAKPDREASQKHSSSTRSRHDLPYLYDANARPLTGDIIRGEQYPLYYTSYHLFAPSPAEARRPGIEYFGEEPESTDPAFYGKYQQLAREVFDRRFALLRNSGDPRAESFRRSEGNDPRRLRRFPEEWEDEGVAF